MEGKFLASPYPVGFRFCPTDVELLVYYLQTKVDGKELPSDVIREANLYEKMPEDIIDTFNLWGEKEWYFFTPRDRKYPNGNRPNRRAGVGYWKATGADKDIKDDNGRDVGVKKSLVYYLGDSPNGNKTNWIMHEYRLKDSESHMLSKALLESKRGSRANMRLDNWVLCRIYKKPSNEDKSSTQGRGPSSSSALIEASTEFESQKNKMSIEIHTQEEEHLDCEMLDHHNSGNKFITDSCSGDPFIPAPEFNKTQYNYVFSDENQFENSHFYQEQAAFPTNLTNIDYISTLQNNSMLSCKPKVYHDPGIQKFDTHNNTHRMLPISQVDKIVHDDQFLFHQDMYWSNYESGLSQLGFSNNLPFANGFTSNSHKVTTTHEHTMIDNYSSAGFFEYFSKKS